MKRNCSLRGAFVTACQHTVCNHWLLVPADWWCASDSLQTFSSSRRRTLLRQQACHQPALLQGATQVGGGGKKTVSSACGPCSELWQPITQHSPSAGQADGQLHVCVRLQQCGTRAQRCWTPQGRVRVLSDSLAACPNSSWDHPSTLGVLTAQCASSALRNGIGNTLRGSQ